MVNTPDWELIFIIAIAVAWRKSLSRFNDKRKLNQVSCRILEANAKHGGAHQIIHVSVEQTDNRLGVELSSDFLTYFDRGCVPVSGDKYILTSWALMQRAEQPYDAV